MDDDRQKILFDALKVGLINVVAMTAVSRLFPNNFMFQAFVSGAIFHITMETLDISHLYLETPQFK
jgi:hypothetical protein